MNDRHPPSGDGSGDRTRLTSPSTETPPRPRRRRRLRSWREAAPPRRATNRVRDLADGSRTGLQEISAPPRSATVRTNGHGPATIAGVAPRRRDRRAVRVKELARYLLQNAYTDF